MFASSMGAKNGSRRFVRLTVAVSVLLHASVGLGLLAVSMWKISKLTPKATELTFYGGGLPPMGEPAAAPSTPKAPKQKHPTPAKPHQLTQPSEKQEPATDASSSETSTPRIGTPDGNEDSNMVDGNFGPFGPGPGPGPGQMVPVEIPDAPKEKKPDPIRIDRSLIEGQRISGVREIQLPDDVVAVVQASGVSKLKVSTLMCIDEQGRPSAIRFERDSGFAAVDRVVEAGMRTWRYQPWVVNGQAVGACFRVVFNYRIGL